MDRRMIGLIAPGMTWGQFPFSGAFPPVVTVLVRFTGDDITADVQLRLLSESVEVGLPAEITNINGIEVWA